MITRTVQKPQSLPRELWSLIMETHQRFESTERGYVWLSKLGPAYLFGLVASFKGWVLMGLLLSAEGSDQGRALHMAYVASSMAFFVLVAAMYVFRKRPLRKVESPIQGLVALAGSYIVLPVVFSGQTNSSESMLLVSTLLMAAGTAGAAFSLAYLGRCFGIFPEARGLITQGPYKLVRHPMYFFEFAAFLGVLLPNFTPLNLLIYVAFVALQLLRINFEEKVLTKTFPNAFPRYRARTARLIPGIY